MNGIVKKLEEAIDLIDKIETFINRVKPNEKISSGLVFQIYQNLVLLREKIIEARMEAVNKCSD
ncbi:MAG: hypothetical protein ABWW65_06320 [Thermoprotei archaeon]